MVTTPLLWLCPSKEIGYNCHGFWVLTNSDDQEPLFLHLSHPIATCFPPSLLSTFTTASTFRPWEITQSRSFAARLAELTRTLQATASERCSNIRSLRPRYRVETGDLESQAGVQEAGLSLRGGCSRLRIKVFLAVKHVKQNMFQP